MGRISLRFLLIVLCVYISFTPANASSVLVSNMTLLVTKAFQTDIKSSGIYKDIETRCLALGLYHEARGEPVIGQYAVGATILNRVRSSAYPENICGVVFQNHHKKYRCQFSFACDDLADTPKNSKSFLQAQRLARAILDKGMHREAKFMGHDFQFNADSMTHYHRHDINPTWSKDLQKLSTLGAHVFLKSTRVTRRYSN